MPKFATLFNISRMVKGIKQLLTFRVALVVSIRVWFIYALVSFLFTSPSAAESQQFTSQKRIENSVFRIYRFLFRQIRTAIRLIQSHHTHSSVNYLYRLQKIQI